MPEWREQYLDYKAGKKMIKRIGQLRTELGEEKAESRPANDTTPLLGPIDSNRPPYHSNDNDGSTKNGGQNEPLPPQALAEQNAAKPSLFSYSLRSSRGRKEELAAEKDKFHSWLASELLKVDGFFREKEHDSYERFLILQDQLYQLRDHKAAIIGRKNAPLVKLKSSKEPQVYRKVNRWATRTLEFLLRLNKLDLPSLPLMTFLSLWKKTARFHDETLDPNWHENQVRNGASALSRGDDDSSVSLSNMAAFEGGFGVGTRPENSAFAGPNSDILLSPRQGPNKDYTLHHAGVPYLHARRQLRDALIEHYRALSLARSFRVLNRTAFRKITKKYDKASGERISAEYVQKLDSEAYFQTSDLLDKLFSHVEEVYILFFEHSAVADRKHSLERLRSLAYAYNNNDIRQPEYYASFFASGWFLGAGAPLLILAAYVGVQKTLSGEMPEGKLLLQTWGGFILLNVTFLLFGINFRVFDAYKINYKFIFEFNVATVLDYRQFWLVPSMCFGFLGLLAWFSLHDFWPDLFPGRLWPWIYVGLVLLIFLWPGPHFYGASRKWLQIALWRIVLLGFYPVEFRDFFLGDILCLLTYSMGNIPFFFCLYTDQWRGLLGGGPPTHTGEICGSLRSRAMGFFSALPSIWRFLQCVRRYMDSGDWFPHLANMLKYAVSALYYCLLSVWRIDRTDEHRVAFIVVAVANSLYTSTWDVVMDWSLGQLSSKHPFLRDHLFFKKPGFYYAAIVINVVLRFQWVFYAFFSSQLQQLAATSFFIGVAEILRRFLWVFFRMENEHCTNVVLFRASKDLPLPYAVLGRVKKAISKLVDLKYHESHLSRPYDEMFEYGQPIGTSVHSQRQYPVLKTDDETDLGLGRMATGATTGTQTVSDRPPAQIARRRSTFMSITDALNKAHIKDFQRKKRPVVVDDESDEDDDDDDKSVKSVLGAGSATSKRGEE